MTGYDGLVEGIISCPHGKGMHLRESRPLHGLGNTAEGGQFAVLVSLVLVVDHAAFVDGVVEGTREGLTYGRTPSMECRKVRTRLRPAFLAPNSNGIC